MALKRGIYCPTLTFFHDDENESVDYERCAQHALHLAKAGVQGLVLQGSTGEAACLTVIEKQTVIETVSKALKEKGFTDTVIIAGIGGQCLQESLTLARTAHKAGANFGIALSPSFFSMHMSEAVLEKYFTRLADGSPMPILIYNFPGVTNGINLSSALLHKLSAHKNIVGTKLTCNTISKIQFLHPEYAQGTFHVLTGSSEFLAAARSAGSIGAITGMANLFPYTMVKLYSLLDAGGNEKEVLRLQNIVTRFEALMMKAFIPGNRAVLEILGQAAGKSRFPIPEATEAEIELYKKEIVEIAAEEQRLSRDH